MDDAHEKGTLGKGLIPCLNKAVKAGGMYALPISRLPAKGRSLYEV